MIASIAIMAASLVLYSKTKTVKTAEPGVNAHFILLTVVLVAGSVAIFFQ